MPIRAVAYVSEAAADVALAHIGVGNDKLDRLVDDASRFNRNAGVTGVLLFDGIRFFQYLEGPEDGLRIAYGRVLDASSHHDVMELQRGLVSERHLPFWPLQWLPVADGEISALANGDWAAFKRTGDPKGLNASGMDVMESLVRGLTRPAP